MNKEKTYEEGFKDGLEAKAVPMGVSEWRQMGKECGYSSYFEPKEKIAIYEELIEWNLGRIIEPLYDEDLSDGEEKWNCCIRANISHLKGRIEELKNENT